MVFLNRIDPNKAPSKRCCKLQNQKPRKFAGFRKIISTACLLLRHLMVRTTGSLMFANFTVTCFSKVTRVFCIVGYLNGCAFAFCNWRFRIIRSSTAALCSCCFYYYCLITNVCKCKFCGSRNMLLYFSKRMCCCFKFNYTVCLGTCR